MKMWCYRHRKDTICVRISFYRRRKPNYVWTCALINAENTFISEMLFLSTQKLSYFWTYSFIYTYTKLCLKIVVYRRIVQFVFEKKHVCSTHKNILYVWNCGVIDEENCCFLLFENVVLSTQKTCLVLEV